MVNRSLYTFPIYPPPQLRKFRKRYQNLSPTKEKKDRGEFKVKHKNGTDLIVEISRGWFQATDGQIFVVITTLDISERKRAELELQQSRERWQLAIETISGGIWDVNLKTQEAFRYMWVRRRVYPLITISLSMVLLLMGMRGVVDLQSIVSHL